jgi:hypothetical protein
MLRPLFVAMRYDRADLSDRFKMIRRFSVAYHLGRYSFDFINSPASPRHLAHVAGTLYAYWALSIISLDRHLDKGHATPLRSDHFSDTWLDAMRYTVNAAGPSLSAAIPLCRPDRLQGLEPNEVGGFSALASTFIQLLAEYCANAPTHQKRCAYADEFLAQTGALLVAQFFSNEQRRIRSDRDWKWYVSELLNQKTLGFFLAPLPLWCSSKCYRGRLDILTDGFLTLNAAYLHWQILDDVADLADDTAGGLITAPGYLLRSQGALAHAWLGATRNLQGDNFPSFSELTSAAKDSLLLCDWFTHSPLLDDHRLELASALDDNTGHPDSTATILRCALANIGSDLHLPLAELCQHRSAQARGYAEAMRSQNWRIAHAALRESHTPERILLAVREDARRITASIILNEPANKSLSPILCTLEMLMLRAHSKAVRTLSDGPGTRHPS